VVVVLLDPLALALAARRQNEEGHMLTSKTGNRFQDRRHTGPIDPFLS